MAETFSMAETAQRFGLPTSTLRYYDKEGLLPGVVRTEGGVRRFTHETLRALHIIACLKMSGLSIQQIRDFFELAARKDTVPERRAIFEQQRKAVQHQIQELEETLAVLDYKCLYYEKAEELGSEAVASDWMEANLSPEMQAVQKRIEQLPDQPPGGNAGSNTAQPTA